MAVATTNANVTSPGAAVLVAASGKTTSVLPVTIATASAQSAAELMYPQSVTATNITVIRLGSAVSRVLVRARLTTATTAVAASPVVRVFGIIGGADDWTAGVPFRLDNLDSDAAGKTLTIPASPSDTNMLRDGSYRYSDAISLTATDLQGATHLVVLVETAASITGGACAIEALIQN